MNLLSSPFLHIAIDNSFDRTLCQQAVEEWPEKDWEHWHATYRDDDQVKRSCNQIAEMPEPCQELLRRMMFIELHDIETTLGHGRLIPDMSLWGGGMHELDKGGFVNMHLDASIHARTMLPRRLNAVLFLDDFQEEDGGQLVLWDGNNLDHSTSITPKRGRLALFESSDRSYHSVTTTKHTRRTLACWWYGPPSGVKKEERLRAQFI